MVFVPSATSFLRPEAYEERDACSHVASMPGPGSWSFKHIMVLA